MANSVLYSPTAGGFYTREIHGDNIPADAVEITVEEHQALIEGQSQGKRIVADGNGFPMLADPPPPSANDVIVQQIAAIEATITGRRIREAVLGIDNGWLKSLNDQIAALRAKLTK